MPTGVYARGGRRKPLTVAGRRKLSKAALAAAAAEGLVLRRSSKAASGYFNVVSSAPGMIKDYMALTLEKQKGSDGRRRRQAKEAQKLILLGSFDVVEEAALAIVS